MNIFLVLVPRSLPDISLCLLVDGVICKYSKTLFLTNERTSITITPAGDRAAGM